MKLISYISRRYIIYAILILLIAIPAFYFSLRYLDAEESDENINHQKAWIEKQLKRQYLTISFPLKTVLSFVRLIIPKFWFLIQSTSFIPDDNETVMHRISVSNTI